MRNLKEAVTKFAAQTQVNLCKAGQVDEAACKAEVLNPYVSLYGSRGAHRKERVDVLTWGVAV